MQNKAGSENMPGSGRREENIMLLQCMSQNSEKHMCLIDCI